MQDGTIGGSRGEVDGPDRLHWRAAAGSGNAGDRHGQMGIGVGERAFGHGARHRFRHGTKVGDQVAGHA